jgi:DNA-binding LacI/PurR family transcriptional regulator
MDKVAARAGVSRATVSRVINGWPTVTQHIRESVQQAVADLGYVPNLAARSLVTQRAGAVALLVFRPADDPVADEMLVSGVIRGISLALEPAHKHLMLMLVDDDKTSDEVERDIVAGCFDGILTVSTRGPRPLPEALARRGFAVVRSGRGPTRARLSYVDVDNVAGARTAVRHLLQRGRRRIATIAGPQDAVAGVDRLAGYRAALREGNCRSIVAVGDFTRRSGVEAMRQLLEDDPSLDGVFAANDVMAFGALAALREAGRRVPDDVSVVGFDDIDATKYTDPPLTTIRQPTVEIGQQMVAQLLRLIDGEDGRNPVILPTELVVRRST